MALYFVMMIRAALLFLPLLVLSCDGDAPPAGGRPAASSAGPGAAAGCSGLADHFREVWTKEAPPGMDRRRTFVLGRVTAAWANACTSVANEPAAELSQAVEELRSAQTLAAIEALPSSGGTAAKRALVKSAKEAVAATKSAFALPASGVDECEEAIASSAFCGDDVDKASVKSAASGKNDGACAALAVLLLKKCGQQ